jgi:hypothetical protein
VDSLHLVEPSFQMPLRIEGNRPCGAAIAEEWWQASGADYDRGKVRSALLLAQRIDLGLQVTRLLLAEFRVPVLLIAQRRLEPRCEGRSFEAMVRRGRYAEEGHGLP